MDNLMEQIQSYVNTFSEPLDEEESDANIDIQKIEEKINKIKSRRKYTENYSGIETLDNIYEPIESKKNTDVVIENFQEGAKNRGKVKTKGKKKKTTIGVLKDYFTIGYNKWNAYLDIANKFIFNGYKILDKQLSKGAFTYVHFLSRATNPKMMDLDYDLSNASAKQKKNINMDTKGVKQYIYTILTLPLCFYATYNWFYLMVYMREKQGSDGEMERPFGDDNRMKIGFHGIKDENIKTFLNFLCQYVIAPLYWLDKIFNDNFYSSFAYNVVQWQILNYFIIFLLVIFINKKVGLFDSLNKLMNNKFPYLFWSCVIIIGLTGLYNIGDFGKTNFTLTNVLPSMLVIFIYIILTTLLMTMSINVSTMIIILFLWIHSIFGIILYNKNNVMGILTEINNINSYIKMDYDNLADDCAETEWFSKYIMYIVKFLNDYRAMVCVFIVFAINFFTIKFHSFYIKLISIILLFFFMMLIFQISQVLFTTD